MSYLMLLPVLFYRVDDDTVACESAFAKHLQELLPRISHWSDRLTVMSPLMSEVEYQTNKKYLAHISCKADRIDHISTHETPIGRIKYMLTAPFTIWPKIWRAVKAAQVVHSGPTNDFFCPYEIVGIIMAVFKKKKTLFFTDIDHRESVDMCFKTGQLSKKSYWLSKHIYTPYWCWQLRFASKYCSLVMLKGKAMTDDFGKGRPSVKNFYDTAHDLTFVLTPAELDSRLSVVDENSTSLKLVYFGRLIEYKGIKDMILATKKIAEKINKDESIVNVHLDIIGSGPQRDELIQFVKNESCNELVNFVDPIAYGQELFDRIKQYDFLLAAPQSQDTPRSVFDAMCVGLPIVGYDTYYYKDLESTGSIATVPWLNIDELANELIKLKKNSGIHKEMVQAAVEFARTNTQQHWLDLRLQYTLEFLGEK